MQIYFYSKWLVLSRQNFYVSTLNNKSQIIYKMVWLFLFFRIIKKSHYRQKNERWGCGPVLLRFVTLGAFPLQTCNISFLALKSAFDFAVLHWHTPRLLWQYFYLSLPNALVLMVSCHWTARLLIGLWCGVSQRNGIWLIFNSSFLLPPFFHLLLSSLRFITLWSRIGRAQ